MPAPVTLQLWREFLATPPVEPPTVTEAEYEALSAEEREVFNDSRFAYIGADVVLQTTYTVAVERTMNIARGRQRANSAVAGRSVTLNGNTGLGKSTMALLEGRRHERLARARFGDDPDMIPVIYVVVLPGSTPKMLINAFAQFYGIPIPPRADLGQAMAQIVAIALEKRTSLVIVDEAHNLVSNKAHGMEAASALKVLSERMNAIFLYSGIALSESALFGDEIGRQIRGRTKLLNISPFPVNDAASRAEWANLIAGMEEVLPLLRHTTGDLVREANYLFQRTGGRIGSLRNLIADAAITAIIDGSECIDRALLDDTPTDEEARQHEIRSSLLWKHQSATTKAAS